MSSISHAVESEAEILNIWNSVHFGWAKTKKTEKKKNEKKKNERKKNEEKKKKKTEKERKESGVLHYSAKAEISIACLGYS